VNQILRDSAKIILDAREGMASVLPSLWSSLDPIFGLEEETESSVWCTYDSGRLLLYSIINLKVKNRDKIKSVASIKQALVESGIEGLLWSYPLNTYSIIVASSAQDGSTSAVELFTHRDIPFLFVHLYIYLNVTIEKFDAQAMSMAYFNFILEHGMISMQGIVKLFGDKSEDEGEVGSLNPGFYSNLYKK